MATRTLRLIRPMLAILALWPCSFAGSPGAPDPAFGTAGRFVRDVFGNDALADVALVPGGKIVAVGSSGVNDFTIIRVTSAGAMDPLFSADGVVFVDFAGGSDSARDVVIQPDGKIVVSGSIPGLSCGVIRLNSNGSLDPSFDVDGRVVVANFDCSALAIQLDGKIVIAGTLPSTTADLVTARLNTNGSLDTTFDTDGIVVTDVEGNERINELAIQADGKIVGVGNCNGSLKSLLVRYNTNGSLDNTFSGDGAAVNDFAVGDAEPTQSLAIDPVNGTIVTVGDNFVGSNSMLFVRYTTTGALDNSFSGDGIFEIPSGQSGSANFLGLQSDGKIVATAENPGATTVGDVVLVRLNPNGTLDTTFGIGGVIRHDTSGGGSMVMALDSDKLIVGGNANNFTDFSLHRFLLTPSPTQSSDFDGDGFTDVVVFRPSTANWFVMRSTDNTVQTLAFGVNGDIPIDGDFDGDGRNDLAIYRPSLGQWWFLRSLDGTNYATTFGTSTDKPVPGDYDKDGKTDIAVFRPSTGEWLIVRSSSNFTNYYGFAFGQSTDIPITRQGL